jgi:polysaccharide deacetylase 2 family uncharacterized protein YibQ
MPQKRKTPRKKQPLPPSKGSLALYLLLAVCLCFIIYWLSKPQGSLKLPGINPVTHAVIDTMKAVPAGQVKPTAGQPTQAPPAEAQSATAKGIASALTKLHIALTDIKTKQKGNEITLQIPVSQDESDLTFANMIIKGEVEQQKGEFVSGFQKGSRQILTFNDKPSGKKYIVELYYKRPEAAVQPVSKAICIIVDDFGNAKGALLTGFAKTNPAICFAILPLTPYASDAMKIATQYKHESIIHVPMEPLNYPREDPGDHAIFIQQNAGEINRRLERFMKKLPDCIGINNHMGSLATADEPTMQAVMQTLRKHNFIFVDSRTTSNSVAYKLAQKNQVTAFKRDIFLDEPDLTDANLDKKITECQTLFQTKAYIITIMHCHTEQHLNYLNKFIARAAQQGFDIVPLSRLGSYKLPEIR